MSFLRCSHVRSRLSAFHDGELGRSETEQVRHHLMECVRCRSRASEFQSISHWLDDAAPLPAPSPAFTDSVMARIRAGEGRDGGARIDSSRELQRAERTARWIALAAAAVVLLAAGYMMAPRLFSSRGTLEAAPRSAIDALIRANDARASRDDAAAPAKAAMPPSSPGEGR